MHTNHMSNVKKPSYYHIPTVVAEKVNPHESFVWSVINWYENMESGRCFASNETIAEALPYPSSVTSVGNALNKLEKNGLIVRKYKAKNKKERLEIKCMVKYMITPTSDTGITHRLDRYHPQVSEVSPTGEQSINKNTNRNIKKEKTSLKNKKKYLKEIPQEDIEEFTRIYKVGITTLKDKAEQLYDWCIANGKSKKDYKAFLRTAIARDFGKRSEQVKDILNY